MNSDLKQKNLVEAAKAAARLVADTAQASDERIAQIVTQGVGEFFNKATKEQRFLDAARIPFICDDIREINKKIDKLVILIYTGVGIVLAVSLFLNLYFK